MAVDLLLLNTIRQLISIKNSKIPKTILIQEVIGIASILGASKIGLNGGIAKQQNNLADFFQKIENNLGITKGLSKVIDYTGKNLNLTPSQIEGYKKYTRSDHYKADRGTIEIFEFSVLQAYVAYQYSGGNPASAIGAFFATEALMWVARQESELKGHEFNFSNSIIRLFGKYPIIGSVAKWLAPHDVYETEDGEYGFDNVEHFINDTLQGKTNIQEETGIKFKDDFEITNPLIDFDTNLLFEMEPGLEFDTDYFDTYNLINEVRDYIELAKEEYIKPVEPIFDNATNPVTPIIDNIADGVTPIFDNAKDGFQPVMDNSKYSNINDYF